MSKLKSTCPKTVLNKFPEKNQFHLSLRNLLRKFWIAQKLGFCQEGLLLLQRNILRKHFLEETKLFLTFRLWTRIVRISGKTKLTDLPKLHSMCPEIHFQKKDFFSIKIQSFGSLLRLWERIFRSLFATLGHGYQTPILRVQSPYCSKSGIGFIFNFSEFWRTLWFALKNSRFVKKDLTLQVNNFLGKTISSTYTALREEWTVVCRNMTIIFAANALHATIEAIWRRRLYFSQKRNFEYNFWRWAENVQSFRKLFPQGCNNRALCFQKKYLKKTSLQEVNLLYLFMVLLRTFWLDGKLHGRQEGILRDQLNVSRKNVWEKPKILEFCEMSEKFQFFGGTVLAELSKLLSVCPENTLRKMKFFSKKIWLWIHFLTLGEKISFLA